MRWLSQGWSSPVLPAILTIALGWTARDLVRPVAADIDIRPYIAAYEPLTARLPADSRIGFLYLAADTVDASAAHFAAQFALAPRILDPTLSDVAFVVTPPFASASVDRDPRLAGFDLAFTGDHGVRVYRRAAQ